MVCSASPRASARSSSLCAAAICGVSCARLRPPAVASWSCSAFSRACAAAISASDFAALAARAFRCPPPPAAYRAGGAPPLSSAARIAACALAILEGEIQHLIGHLPILGDEQHLGRIADETLLDREMPIPSDHLAEESDDRRAIGKFRNGGARALTGSPREPASARQRWSEISKVMAMATQRSSWQPVSPSSRARRLASATTGKAFAIVVVPLSIEGTP